MAPFKPLPNRHVMEVYAEYGLGECLDNNIIVLLMSVRKLFIRSNQFFKDREWYYNFINKLSLVVKREKKNSMNIILNTLAITSI